MRFLVVPALSLAIAALGVLAAPSLNLPTLVNLRIEGRDRTIYEGAALTLGHDITTASGGTHHCDGTNLLSPSPGPTCISALNDASQLSNFDYDGTYSLLLDDFHITRIGDSTQTLLQSWGLFLNYQLVPFGGCQQQVAASESILWAFDAFSKLYLLNLASSGAAHIGRPYTFTVTDGKTGTAVAGATVASADGSASATTGADGTATLTFMLANLGLVSLKAGHPSAIRSNRVDVTVLLLV